MSDRVAVMNEGRVEQCGPPREIYENPETLFVADFLGVSNLIAAEAGGTTAGGCRLAVGDFVLRAEQGTVDARGPVKAMIRPERVRIEAHGTPGENRLPGMVEHTVFLGSFQEVIVRLAMGDVVRSVLANDGAPTAFRQGTPVAVHLPADGLRVLVGPPPAVETQH